MWRKDVGAYRKRSGDFEGARGFDLGCKCGLFKSVDLIEQADSALVEVAASGCKCQGACCAGKKMQPQFAFEAIDAFADGRWRHS